MLVISINQILHIGNEKMDYLSFFEDLLKKNYETSKKFK